MALYTQAEADALKAAIVSGVLEVRYDGPPMRWIKYQSLAAMRAQLADMLADINRAAGGSSYVLASTSKGFSR